MYLLDTNICIYAIKNEPAQVSRKLKENISAGLYISAITLAELEYGVKKSAKLEKNRALLAEFVSVVEVLPFDSQAAIEYGELRALLQKAGTPIGAMDMLIAAHAKACGKILVTNNEREFERVPSLKIENWV